MFCSLAGLILVFGTLKFLHIPLRSFEHMRMKGIEMELKPICVTVADACRLSGLGRTKIYELISQNQLESTVVGCRRLIRYESLDRLLMHS